MSPKKVLLDLLRGLAAMRQGSSCGNRSYEDLFKASLRHVSGARRDGLIALESHLSEPEKSTIFAKYPLFAGTATPWNSCAGRCRRSWKGR